MRMIWISFGVSYRESMLIQLGERARVMLRFLNSSEKDLCSARVDGDRY